VEQCRRRQLGRPWGHEALERRGAGLGVLSSVVDGLHPGTEEAVELGEVGHAAGFELDDEATSCSLEESFYLPFRGRRVGPGVDQADAQDRAGPVELGVAIRGAVVDQEHLGHPARTERGAKRLLHADRVLRGTPPIAREQPRVVVQKREEICLVAADHWPVHRVAEPAVVSRLRLVAPVGLRRRAVGCHVEPETGEVALDGALGGARCGPRLGHHPQDLGGGALGHLALERGREVEHGRWRVWLRAPWRGAEGLEAAGAPRADPAVQRRTTDPDTPTVKAGVVHRGERPHEGPAVGLGELRIGGLTHQ